MKSARVIIGANYGDEGKGLMTDYVADLLGNEGTVIRFNGGAQAGYTVVTPDGRRHVFSHFGAGTLCGYDTYLSQFFIVNPMLFERELDLLLLHGIRPSVWINPDAMLTTPFDVFINGLIEKKRNARRHGSCGVGINETVTRCLRDEYCRTNAKDVLKPAFLRRKLLAIAEQWVPIRLAEHNLERDCDDVNSFLSKLEPIIDSYIDDTAALLSTGTISRKIPKAGNLIFEGAQGLMLDENRIDQWPHVTRSRTGLTNVVHLANELGLDRLNVTYVSRTYLTKHGAGPLPDECNWNLDDLTNVPNAFQGTIRFAPLNYAEMAERIGQGLAQARRTFRDIEANIAFTCADQMPPLQKATSLEVPVAYVSTGRTRRNVDCLREGVYVSTFIAKTSSGLS